MDRVRRLPARDRARQVRRALGGQAVTLPRCWKHPRERCSGFCQYVLRHDECAADRGQRVLEFEAR